MDAWVFVQKVKEQNNYIFGIFDEGFHKKLQGFARTIFHFIVDSKDFKF
jgi:hypothetical protein